LQTQESSEKTEVQEELTKLACQRDAMVVAAFYRQLITEKIPENVAKDLTIAYIVKPNLFGQ
jgi:hypothetical protein